MNKALSQLIALSAIVLSTAVCAEESIPDVSGALEIELSANQIGTPTAELSFSQELADRVSAEMLILYEEGITGIDTAAINIAPKGAAWSLSFGNIYLPFGNFDTRMASDPLTRSLGETRENAIRYDYKLSNLSTSFYLFNGTNDVGGNSAVDNYGFKLKHASALMGTSFSFINDIGDSNALQDAITTLLGNNNTSAQVPGYSIGVWLSFGSVSLNSEIISAQKAFQAGQVDAVAVQPTTTSIELDYSFHIFGNESSLAIETQSSRDASVLDLPESRLLLGLNSSVQKDTHLILQASQDTDYASVITTDYVIKLVAEF